MYQEYTNMYTNMHTKACPLTRHRQPLHGFLRTFLPGQRVPIALQGGFVRRFIQPRDQTNPMRTVFFQPHVHARDHGVQCGQDFNQRVGAFGEPGTFQALGGVNGRQFRQTIDTVILLAERQQHVQTHGCELIFYGQHGFDQFNQNVEFRGWAAAAAAARAATAATAATATAVAATATAAAVHGAVAADFRAHSQQYFHAGHRCHPVPLDHGCQQLNGFQCMVVQHHADQRRFLQAGHGTRTHRLPLVFPLVFPLLLLVVVHQPHQDPQDGIFVGHAGVGPFVRDGAPFRQFTQRGIVAEAAQIDMHQSTDDVVFVQTATNVGQRSAGRFM